MPCKSLASHFTYVSGDVYFGCLLIQRYPCAEIRHVERSTNSSSSPSHLQSEQQLPAHRSDGRILANPCIGRTPAPFSASPHRMLERDDMWNGSVDSAQTSTESVKPAEPCRLWNGTQASTTMRGSSRTSCALTLHSGICTRRARKTGE